MQLCCYWIKNKRTTPSNLCACVCVRVCIWVAFDGVMASFQRAHKKEVSNDINMLKTGWVRCDSYIYNHFVFTQKRLSECHQFNHVASTGNQRAHLLILHCCRGSYALLPTDLIWAQKPSERKNQNGCQRLDQKDEPCQLMATWPVRIFGMPLISIEMDGFVIIIKPFQKTPVVFCCFDVYVNIVTTARCPTTRTSTESMNSFYII